MSGPGSADRRLHAADGAEFEAWLAANHADSAGVWLEIAKKHGGAESISYAEALDVALCFGWIDSAKAKLDDATWLQRFTPRTARSRWSKVNRRKVERLIAAGRMHPPGQAEIDRAKADGRWDAAYAGQGGAEMPADLQSELDLDPDFAAAFAALDGRNRYSIIYRLNDAKRPETRARRLAKFVEMVRRGERIHE